MQIENSNDRYGLIAQLFHLTMAVLFVGGFASVYFRQWFTLLETDVNMAALHLHLSFGISIFGLAIFRLWWRWRSKVQPAELPGTDIEHKAAHGVHWLLYILIFFMPLTGYLGTGLATDFFGLFTIPRFADTAAFDLIVSQGMGMDFEEFEKPVDWLHKTLGEVAALFLIGIHIGAALFHHFIRRDGILGRMFSMFKASTKD